MHFLTRLELFVQTPFTRNSLPFNRCQVFSRFSCCTFLFFLTKIIFCYGLCALVNYCLIEFSLNFSRLLLSLSLGRLSERRRRLKFRLDRIELINLIVKTRVEVLEREMLWEHKRISSFPKLQMLLTVLGLFLKYLLHIYLTQKFEKAKFFGKVVKTV